MEPLVELVSVELPMADYTTASRCQSSRVSKLGPLQAARLREVTIVAIRLKVLGVGESYLRSPRNQLGSSRGCLPCMKPARAGHFVPERGEMIVRRMLATLG